MLEEIELFCCLTCSGDAMDDDGSMDCLGCENNEPSMKFMILRCKRDVMLLLHVLYTLLQNVICKKVARRDR